MFTQKDENGFIRIPNNRYADHNIVYSFKGRQIETEKPVRVYRNLHTGGYSIKQNGLVVAHAERLCLGDFKCIVNEKGRQKIIKTKQKNVHAFIEGKYTTSGMGTSAERNDLGVTIKYDPYKYPFFYSDNLTIHTLKVKGGGFCILDENGVKGAYTYTER